MGDRGQDPGAVPAAVALIGCGAIGSAADETRGGSDVPLTHAGAISAAQGVELIALCDADEDRVQAAGEHWGVPASGRFTSFEAVFDAVQPDIVVIATPSSLRESVISAACAAGVRRLVIEKPVAPSLEEAMHVRRVLKTHNVDASVGYLRRYPAVLRDVAARVHAGALGSPCYVVVHYGKGFANNGSHALDLLAWLLGPAADVHVHGRCADDRANGDDPTFEATVRFRGEGGLIGATFLPSDHRAVSVFEIDIFGTAGRLRLTERGQRVELSRVAPDAAFPGYTALQPVVTFHDAAVDGMTALWADVAAGREASCTYDDGLAALAVVEAARISARTGLRAAVHLPFTAEITPS